MAIRDSIIASATEGASAPQEMSDIEKAARAIVVSLGGNPDALGYNGEPISIGGRVRIMPPHAHPVWTFFTSEAEAALASVAR